MVLAVYLNRINVSLFSLDFLLDSRTPLLLLFFQTMFVTTFALFIYSFADYLSLAKFHRREKRIKAKRSFFLKRIQKRNIVKLQLIYHTLKTYLNNNHKRPKSRALGLARTVKPTGLDTRFRSIKSSLSSSFAQLSDVTGL